MKSEIVVRLTSPIECTTIPGGCGDPVAATKGHEVPGRTSIDSFKLEVKDPSSEQDENEGVGDDPCWIFPVELEEELEELDLCCLTVPAVLLLNSRNPPSSGLSLPPAAACSDFLVPDLDVPGNH